jgi:hypothetical protein
MTYTTSRREHLLALASEAERQAAQLSRKGRKEQYDAERYRRLAAIYEEMAQAAA